MGNKILVHDLKRNFGELEVLKDISVEIREGEAARMVGPSGPGKSTFLRRLNCLEKITSGRVVVDGHPMSSPNINVNEAWESVGMVFQYFNLFPHLTAKENITLTPAGLKLMGEEEAGRKVLELLARAGLADKTETYPGQLSGGQKQRVAITCSLTMNPDIVPSDEPTSALDPEVVGEALEVMKQSATNDMTMVVVTHETGFAREMADRVVFMDGGYTIREGTSDEVFRNSREERAGSFLDKVLQKAGFHEE